MYAIMNVRKGKCWLLSVFPNWFWLIYCSIHDYYKWIIDLNWSIHAKIPLQFDYRTSKKEKKRPNSLSHSAIHLIFNSFNYFGVCFGFVVVAFSFIHWTGCSLHNFPLHLFSSSIIPLPFHCTSNERCVAFYFFFTHNHRSRDFVLL